MQKETRVKKPAKEPGVSSRSRDSRRYHGGSLPYRVAGHGVPALSGELPGRKVGRKWVTTRAAVVRWLEHSSTNDHWPVRSNATTWEAASPKPSTTVRHAYGEGYETSAARFMIIYTRQPGKTKMNRRIPREIETRPKLWHKSLSTQEHRDSGASESVLLTLHSFWSLHIESEDKSLS